MSSAISFKLTVTVLKGSVLAALEGQTASHRAEGKEVDI